MKVRILRSIIILYSVCVCSINPLMAVQYWSASISPASDFYSGSSNLKTIGLGRSAYTTDGRTGVGVNIYQKRDGSYVVQVIEHKMIQGRQKSIVAKGYIKAWRDKENRIWFKWNNREYRTSPQIFRN